MHQLLDDYITRHVALWARSRSMENARSAQRVLGGTELELPTGEVRAFGDWFVRDVTADAIAKV